MERRSQRGATSIIVAVTSSLLVGMAAVAVDLGAAWNERRVDQSGADLAALAGAVELATGSSPQLAVDAVVASVNVNVGTVTDAEWGPASCSDSEKLDNTTASLGLTPASDCISFSKDFSEVRVRVPDQAIDAVFGDVLGVGQLTTHAAANAVGTFPGGSPPPFAVLDGFEAGDSACLRTSSNIDPGEVMQGNGPGVPPSPVAGSVDACNSDELDISSEFMGTLDPPIWFDDDGNVICKSNETAFLIADGIGHQLSRFIDIPTPGASPPYGTGGYGVPDPRTVEDDCAPIPSSKPNTIRLTTGLTNSALRCGLLTAKSGGCGSSVPGPTGVASVDARLQRGAFVQSTHQFVGEDMDNRALWSFLRSDIGDTVAVNAPAACRNVYANRDDASWDYYDKRDEMVECLEKWKDTSYDPIFSDIILEGARFSFVPLLAESDLDAGPGPCPHSTAPKCVHIDDWVPVYVQTLYVESSGLSADCDPNNVDVGRHHAGQEFGCGSSNKNVDAVSAIVLACGMLPENVCNSSSGNPHDPGGDPVPDIHLDK